MKPYYEAGGVTIYHGDCREIMPALAFDVVVTDPPYGLGDRWTGGTWFNRGVYATDKCEWDKAPPHEAIRDIVGKAVPSVVWGGNYFAMPPSRCWLAWIKGNAVPTMADMELAWTSLDRPAKTFSAPCGVSERVHPTQKPVGLIKWCVEMLPPGVILDPFMGSGTTLVAAKELGRRAIGIEIEERYCEIAARRLDNCAVLPFTETAAVETQGELTS